MQSNIFANTKKFAKSFLSVHMGPRSNLLRQKNGKNSRDTVPSALRLISFIWRYTKSLFNCVYYSTFITLQHFTNLKQIIYLGSAIKNFELYFLTFYLLAHNIIVTVEIPVGRISGRIISGLFISGIWQDTWYIVAGISGYIVYWRIKEVVFSKYCLLKNKGSSFL